VTLPALDLVAHEVADFGLLYTSHGLVYASHGMLYGSQQAIVYESRARVYEPLPRSPVRGWAHNLFGGVALSALDLVAHEVADFGLLYTSHRLLYTSHGLSYTSHGLLYTNHGLFHTSHGMLYTSHRLLYTSHGLSNTSHGLLHTNHSGWAHNLFGGVALPALDLVAHVVQVAAPRRQNLPYQ